MLFVKFCLIFYLPYIIETIDDDAKGFINQFEELKRNNKLPIKQSQESIEVESFDSSYKIQSVELYKVGDKGDLAHFTKHVYTHAVRTIRRINSKLDKSLRSNLSILEDGYKWKFKQFLNETLGFTVRTRSGPHKIILNTLQTSDHILKRLINHILYNLAKDGNKHKSDNVENILRSEIEKNSEFEYEHICKKYHICRANKNFSSFLTNILIILSTLQADKVKTSTIIFSKVLEETDVSKLMDKQTESKFKRNIRKLESFSGEVIKATYSILKNTMISRYKPVLILSTVYIRGSIVSLSMETVTEVLDILNEHLPPTAENQSKWSAITSSLREWSEGKRNDILNIAQDIVNQFKEGVNAINASTIKRLQKLLRKLMLG